MSDEKLLKVLEDAIDRARLQSPFDVPASARAALEAMRKAGYVVVPQSALDWLHGSGPDANGEWFGEAEQTGQGPYWWRSHFRELVAAQEDT